MKRSLIVPSLLVAATLVVVSGACSQHDPGPYEGGGRTMPTSVIGNASGGGGTPPDASFPDVFTLPETGPAPDAFGGGD